jgi:hypothetical protein
VSNLLISYFFSSLREAAPTRRFAKAYLAVLAVRSLFLALLGASSYRIGISPDKKLKHL